MRESTLQFVMTSHDSAKYPKTKTLPCKLESVGLGGFYFLLSQNGAKTFARIRTSCGILFFRLPRFCVAKSRNDGVKDSSLLLCESPIRPKRIPKSLQF